MASPVIDESQRRSDLQRLAAYTAMVMDQAATSRRAIAASYRRMAHFGDHRSEYFGQRAADFDELARRAQLFADSELAVAARQAALLSAR
ncbi:MAG TPA: hypothetical protein VIY28_18305 [Pseudonocardiaceae bacterium]